MPNKWADLNFGPRAPTYSEYQFIASKAKRLPMSLSEREYNDLMQNGSGKSGSVAWANAIDWKMFSLMKPKVDASIWLQNRYAAQLSSACRHLVAHRDKAEKEASEKRLAEWRKGKKRDWKEMERKWSGETTNELVSHQHQMELEVRRESRTSGQPSNGSLRLPTQSAQLPFRSRNGNEHNQRNTPLKRKFADWESDSESEGEYERKKLKYDVQATITTLQEQVARLIRKSDGVNDELKFLGKGQAGLWEAYESLQKDYQELKEMHNSLCRLLGVVAERGHTEGVRVKEEEE